MLNNLLPGGESHPYFEKDGYVVHCDAPIPDCAAQYFGAWMVDPSWLAQAVADVKAGAMVIYQPKAAARESEGPAYLKTADGLATISLVGPMTKGDSSFSGGTSTVRTRRAIRQAAADPNIRGIMLLVDSPGGTAAGTSELGADVAAAARQKPVHAHAEDMMASAAYWVGAQASRVTATPTSLVGSIGTYSVVTDSSGRAAKDGVVVHVLSTGAHKGAGVPGAPVTTDQLRVAQGVVDELNEHFLAAVASGRRMPLERVKQAADGRIYLAQPAMGLGLLDAVESQDAAYAALRAACQGLQAGSPLGAGIAGVAQDVPQDVADTELKADANAPANAAESAHKECEVMAENMVQEQVAPVVPAPVVSAQGVQEPKSDFGDLDRLILRQQRAKAIMARAMHYATGNPDRAEAIKAAAESAVEHDQELRDVEVVLMGLARPVYIPPVKPTELPLATELEAGLALAGNLPNIEKHYGAEVLDRADQKFHRGLTLQETIFVMARSRGWTGHSVKSDLRGALRAAMPARSEIGGPSMAFSTLDLSGILGNVANKFLLSGFMSVERTWRNICSIKNVSDFKTVTSYRLTGKDQYELVAPGGEIHEGTLTEDSFTNKADTYGLRLTIDRRDVINDDLGAITTVPQKLGRGSGLKINDIFWTVFLNNGAFFVDATYGNYISGATTLLGIEGLRQGVVKFLKMTDSDGKPTGIMPAILLSPPDNHAMARQLYTSMEIRAYEAAATTQFATANPYQSQFRPEVSRYISNTNYTGATTTQWYLLADPRELATVEVAFLNGQESPTIETSEADFNVLGIQMRGYHDFGVALQDPKAGIKSAGA